MRERKKLLFVINTLSAAGAEKSFLALLHAMDVTAYEIDVLVLLSQGELRAQLPDGVRVVNRTYSEESVLTEHGQRQLKKTVLRAALYHLNGLRQLPYLLRMAAAMKRSGRFQADKLLWQVVSRGTPRLHGRYDLAVAYLEGGSAYYVADRVEAEKKVAFFHSDYARSGYTRALDRACYLKFDQVFTVSSEGTRNFLAVYPELSDRVRMFHNPLDLAKIREKSRETVTDPRWSAYDGIRILSVGRLVPLKAYDTAIEAMRILRGQGIGVRWYVLGEGSERAHLTQLIEDYDLQEDFFLLGATDNPYPYFAGCDLYVHISHYEGRSVAIQEAQALGCAVLASDCSGNREQITDGADGVLVKTEAGAVADRICALVNDADQRSSLGACAAEKPTVYPQDIDALLAFAQ